MTSLLHGPLIKSGFRTFCHRCKHWTSVRPLRHPAAKTDFLQNQNSKIILTNSMMKPSKHLGRNHGMLRHEKCKRNKKKLAYFLPCLPFIFLNCISQNVILLCKNIKIFMMKKKHLNSTHTFSFLRNTIIPCKNASNLSLRQRNTSSVPLTRFYYFTLYIQETRQDKGRRE